VHLLHGLVVVGRIFSHVVGIDFLAPIQLCMSQVRHCQKPDGRLGARRWRRDKAVYAAVPQLLQRMPVDFALARVSTMLSNTTSAAPPAGRPPDPSGRDTFIGEAWE